MAQLTSFSFANLSCLIDGVPLTGFWEGDDAIVIDQNSQDGNAIVGVDGDAVVSRPVDQSVNITLRVAPNSAAHRLLTNKKRAIDNNTVENFAISITDTGNGEGGSSTQATIIGTPVQQFGENAVAREWVIFANDYRVNEIDYTL